MHSGRFRHARFLGICNFLHQEYHPCMSLKTLGVKHLTSITQPLVIASGLSVGKEGPSVHVACCIGSLVAGLFDNFRRSQSKRRNASRTCV